MQIINLSALTHTNSKYKNGYDMIARFSILMRALTNSHFNLTLNCQSMTKVEISSSESVDSDSKSRLFFFKGVSSRSSDVGARAARRFIVKLPTFDLAL